MNSRITLALESAPTEIKALLSDLTLIMQTNVTTTIQ